MAGSERHYHDAPSPTLHFRRANDGVFRIVAPFDDHVRLEMPDEVERRVLREDYDEIDAFERRQHVCAFGVAAHGARRTLEAAHGLIAVDSDDERVGGVARGGEDVDVPGMKQVEHTVGKRYPTLPSISPPLGLGPCCNLRRGISRRQGLLDTVGWKWMTCSFFIGSFMTSS
jgi:hypothetical protein